MLFIGYYLPIFIIILAGVIFILTSIFKYYNIYTPSQYYISIQDKDVPNKEDRNNQNTINSTIMVSIYYQNGFSIQYVPSFIVDQDNWNIYYNITNTYSGGNNNVNVLRINPENITNISSRSYSIESLNNVDIESVIRLSNNTFEGNSVTYTYRGNRYECSVVGNNRVTYQAGGFVYFCILCKSSNSQNIQNFYLNEPLYINITPAISLLDKNQYPNSKYYDYTINNVKIINGTYLAIPLSNNGGYVMDDFQNILVIIGPPLSNYIKRSPHVGSNVVFILNYKGKYYALPSWYAGEHNRNYYFFINLLNVPSLYSNNFGCNIVSLFVGFSDENLLPYFNGTIGGAPEALSPNKPSSAVIYDNGLNVFPIYVNFYPYPDNNVYWVEMIPSDNCDTSKYKACYQNNNILLQHNNILPPYNNVNVYLNGTARISIVIDRPFKGLLMVNGTKQGSYALITSDILKNTFYRLSKSQNGLGLQTFAYFSGIPWLDPPLDDSVPLVSRPLVSHAVVLSYIADNNNLKINTVNHYNDYNLNNRICSIAGDCISIGNRDIGIRVGGETYLPLNFPMFMYEYGWVPGGARPGNTAGYYVGILQYNNTIGYFLTTKYTKNPNTNANNQYWNYYYSGTGWSTLYSLTCPLGCPKLNYYFLEDNTGNIRGYEGENYFPFMPPNQKNNQQYYQYGVFWLYNWFQTDVTDNNKINIFFLMNGNIFNYSLASVQYSWNGKNAYAIPPAPPGNISATTKKPIFVQSYINAYNTAFNQPANRQNALNRYFEFTFNDVDNNFVYGTFGFKERYNSLSQLQSVSIYHLQDDINVYVGTPYLFISAGSGNGPGFIYLNWIIVTYGVPYVVSIS
ncbi:MAG: hypothetical protein ACO2ON_02325 [Candidatus Nanopusillus sp.]